MEITANNFWGYILLLVGLVEFVLFIYVLRYEKTPTILAYAGFVLGVVIWVVSNGVSLLSGEGDITFIQKFTFFGGTILISSLFVFSHLFPYPKHLYEKYLWIFSTIATLGFGIWMFTAKNFMGTILLDQDGYMHTSTDGIGIWVWTYFFIVTWVLTFIELIRRFMASTGLERKRLGYLCIGITITSIIGVTTDVVMPLTQTIHYSWLGPLFSVVWLWFSFKAVRKFDA